jgi:hypothetical protein
LLTQARSSGQPLLVEREGQRLLRRSRFLRFWAVGSYELTLACRLQLDEPIGVGFSYAENGQVVGRAEQAALDVQAFIAIFIETFKEFKGRPLHLVSQACSSTDPAAAAADPRPELVA